MARAAPESRQQARTIAYSLARALRALAGGLSWERLGRIALLENASEILSKSLPEASRDLPELTLALLGLILTLLGVIWGSCWASWGSFWASWGAPGRSWGALGEPLGSLLDPPRPSKIAPGGSPGGPPHRSLILAPFWLRFGGHFGSILGPPGPQKTWFSCGGCVIFRKNEGFGKTP